MMSKRDDFTKVGGKLLGTGPENNVLPRSGYDKENALKQFNVKLDEHSQYAESVQLTPNALKNLARGDFGNKAKDAQSNINGTFRRGRVDYN